MGMTCTLYRVPSADIEALIRDPAIVRRLLFGDDDAWTVTKPKGLAGFLLRFTPISIETATPNKPLNDADFERIREMECDLEGTWHGLHFLFTGTAWEGTEPACYLVHGGEEVGDDDFDLPPRLLRPYDVRAFNGFLAGLSDDELRHRYDPKLMARLKIDRAAAQDDQAFALLLRSFDGLKVFTAKASAAGDGLLVHLG
jgi:hypothetical protein